MQVIAINQSVKMSPRKVRLVADLIRGASAKQAIVTLSLLRKRAASELLKTLKSAIANAIHNAKLQEDVLFIKGVDVSDGPALKRYHPSTRGRTHPYKKRSSHIRVILEGKK